MHLGDLPAGRVGLRVLVALLRKGPRDEYPGRSSGRAVQHALHGRGLLQQLLVLLVAEELLQQHVGRAGLGGGVLLLDGHVDLVLFDRGHVLFINRHLEIFQSRRGCDRSSRYGSRHESTCDTNKILECWGAIRHICTIIS